MDMKQNVRLSQTQKLVMTMRLQQALKLLALPTLELQEEIKAELEENPLLEEAEDRAREGTMESREEEPRESDQETAENDFDWESFLQDASDSGYAPASERHEEQMERANVSPVSLQDTLEEQVMADMPGEEDQAVMEFLIGSLDERGFLTLSAEEVVAYTGSELERVQRLIKQLQQCEPAGVGARDLQDCLLIQLEVKGEKGTLAYEIIEGFWEELQRKRLPEIAKALKVPVGDVQTAVDDIAHLSPSPAGMVVGEQAQYIYPDLIVERVDGEYVVSLNDKNVPRLRVSRKYEEVLMSRNGHDPATRDFVKEKLRSAKWIVQTIEQRRRTMVKVMQKIVEKQRGFFDKGVMHMKPLTLQDVATEIEMHESTVSRVTNGKYVQTPRGVLELKFFFSSGLGTAGSEDISSKAAKERIRRLVDGEDRAKPLSDQKLADMLKAEGIDIARRTVAKYREQLGLASARMRRRH